MNYTILASYMEVCKRDGMAPTFLGLSFYQSTFTGDSNRVNRRQALALKRLQEKQKVTNEKRVA